MVNPYFANYEKLRRPAFDDFYKQPNVQMQMQQTGPTDQGNWFQRNQWSTKDTSGVGAIGGAVASAIPSTQDGRFSVDKNAGFKGSFQGLGQGGVVGAIAGGVMAQLGESGRVRRELDNLSTGVEGFQRDAYGNPVYSGGNISQAMSTIKELKKGEESMEFGKGLDPATAVFNIGNRRRARRKRQQLQRNLQTAQQNYNTAEASNRAQANQLEDYYQRMNSYSRMNNLYR